MLQSNLSILTRTLHESFSNSSEKIRLFTALCRFNFQICDTFLQVFVSIFRLRLILCKCVLGAFIQRSWRTRNWTIAILVNFESFSQFFSFTL